jgi:NAD(P)H-nitrite reductase large subunit
MNKADLIELLKANAALMKTDADTIKRLWKMVDDLKLSRKLAWQRIAYLKADNDKLVEKCKDFIAERYEERINQAQVEKDFKEFIDSKSVDN